MAVLRLLHRSEQGHRPRSRRLPDITREFLHLGLPVVRHLTAARGGTARAPSTPGAGSVCTLRLPAAATAPRDG
ncbi:hypothetical protein [Streptomyces sp. NPDC048734]|uniref:hypothetical protein n=1 Tax=Streptomyces sp. NPDC048734 TaxID=3365590 RepID=UPI003719A244